MGIKRRPETSRPLSHAEHVDLDMGRASLMRVFIENWPPNQPVGTFADSLSLEHGHNNHAVADKRAVAILKRVAKEEGIELPFNPDNPRQI